MTTNELVFGGDQTLNIKFGTGTRTGFRVRPGFLLRNIRGLTSGFSMRATA